MYSGNSSVNIRTKIILYVLSTIMIGIAIPHFFYAVYLSEILRFYEENSSANISSINQEFSIPPTQYYSLVGIFQILINLFYIYQLRKTQTNSKIRFNIILLLIVCQFAFVLSISVYNSLIWSQNQGILYWSKSFSEEQLRTMSPLEMNLYNKMIRLYRLTGIESNVCFIFAVPIIILQFLVFYDINNLQQQSIDRIIVVEPMQQQSIVQIHVQV